MRPTILTLISPDDRQDEDGLDHDTDEFNTACSSSWPFTARRYALIDPCADEGELNADAGTCVEYHMDAVTFPRLRPSIYRYDSSTVPYLIK
jgi:hypothetical protein